MSHIGYHVLACLSSKEEKAALFKVSQGHGPPSAFVRRNITVCQEGWTPGIHVLSFRTSEH